MSASESKTITIQKRDGEHTVTFELHRHHTWSAIIYTHKDGNSMMNEFGGYRTRNVGAHAYIDRLWRKLA